MWGDLTRARNARHDDRCLVFDKTSVTSVVRFTGGRLLGTVRIDLDVESEQRVFFALLDVGDIDAVLVDASELRYVLRKPAFIRIVRRRCHFSHGVVCKAHRRVVGNQELAEKVRWVRWDSAGVIVRMLTLQDILDFPSLTSALALGSPINVHPIGHCRERLVFEVFTPLHRRKVSNRDREQQTRLQRLV